MGRKMAMHSRWLVDVLGECRIDVSPMLPCVPTEEVVPTDVGDEETGDIRHSFPLEEWQPLLALRPPCQVIPCASCNATRCCAMYARKSALSVSDGTL
jgi:hypothetical protein